MADPKKSSTPQPIFVGPATWRENVRDKAVESLRNVFPFVGKRYTIDVDNVHVKPMDYGPEDYKRAIMTGRSLSEPVKGTLLLRDNNTGKTLQRVPNFNLVQLPYYTAHHTFILDGNPITVNNQLRMKPGVYARKKRNEELEAQFNVGKGVPFRMTMDPESGHFHLEYQATRIPLYSVLNKLGVSDKTVAQYWSPKLTQSNQAAFGNKIDQHFNKFYEKAVRPFERKEGVSPAQAVADVLQNTKLDPFVTKELLGKSFDHVTPETLLMTSQKLLRAYNDKQDFDERDNLAYKRILGADDFIAERIKLDARDLRRKFLTKLEYGKADLTKVIPSSPFTKGIRNFLNTTQLKGTITQINPLEIMDSAVRITSMGEGGISSERGVPQEARYLHGTHMAAIDPVRTPESHHAGVEVHASLFMARDRNGNIYTALKDRAGKTKYVPITESTKSAIAFPDQVLKGKVDAMVAGRQLSVPANRVKYQVPHPNAMYSLSTNMIPFLDSIDGNRAEMGSKMVTQALPLQDAEPPLIQVSSYRPGMTMEQELARRVIPTAPISGVVTKIRDGRIYIRPAGEKTSAVGGAGAAVPFFQNFPLNSKTYLHDEPIVKPGDVVKAGQPLANSLFTRDGQMALGKNLRVAYIPLRGMNSNDAVVISESAAKKLTSMHMYKPTLELDDTTKVHRETHRAYFGNKFQKAQYDKLDSTGVIKPGTVVNPGDPLIAAVQKTELSSEARLLGKLHKSLVRPYRDASLVWDGETQGVVTDIARTGGQIRLTVKTKEPMRVGDKLAGRYGNKGVVSAILPDEHMFQDEKGRPIDLAVSPAGVVSRINPAQVLETALARVAEKTGKPIAIDNFAPRDNVQFVKSMLKRHNLKDTETLTDPMTGKKIPNILVGPQYIFKLMKTTSTNFSARGVEDYDVNQQPSAGGPTGSKGMGRMELNALLAHNARNILRETSVLKSQKNDEWWRAYQLGLPPPPLKTSFAYDKFGTMLAGAGIKMNKRDNFIALGPLTDRDVSKMSAGAIKTPKFILAKNLDPERGGFFDPVLTGGMGGTKWSHIELQEPLVNPIFERPVKTLLGLKQKEFDSMLREEGGAGIKKRLAQIDVDQRKKEVMKELKAARADKRDGLVKELKYLQALHESNMRPDEAYVISKVPVIPPIYRPIVPGAKGQLQISDPNYLLRDAMVANELLAKTQSLPGAIRQDARTHLYDAVGALYGTRPPVSPQLINRNAQGYIARIAGADSPKSGFFHSALIRKQQDISGRGTIAPDAALAMDEVGLPEDAGWAMYAPFVVRNLVNRGYKAMEAKKLLEDRHPVAKDALQAELSQRPVLINRAPSLYRFNVLAAFPKLVPGKTIRVPEALAPIQSGDFDGDAVNITVPVTPPAVEEAKQMTLPNMLLSDQYKFTLTKAAPQQESILGIYRATNAKQEGKPRVFENKADAMKAYNMGEIGLGTPVIIKNSLTKISSPEFAIFNWCPKRF